MHTKFWAINSPSVSSVSCHPYRTASKKTLMGSVMLHPAVHKNTWCKFGEVLRGDEFEKNWRQPLIQWTKLSRCYNYQCSREKSESCLFHLPPSLWHLAVPRVAHQRRLTGVHQATVSWGAVWSLEPAAVYRLHAPPVIHRDSPALAIYFHRFSFTAGVLVCSRFCTCTLWHSQRHVTLFLFCFGCFVLSESVLDRRCVIDNRETPPPTWPV